MELLERNFSLPDELSDVIISVEGQTLYAHRQILAEWSSLWRRQFLSDHKLSDNVKIALPGKRARDIVSLLHCIYSTQKPVTDHNLPVLLTLAEEFEIPKVRERCEKFLLSKTHPVLPTLALAEKYQLRQVYNQCLDKTRDMTLHEIERDLSQVAINSATESEIFKCKVRALQENSQTLKRELMSLKQKCMTLEQDKRAMQEAVGQIQKMWEARNKRCYKHVNDENFDFTCGDCNERVKREVRHMCSSGMLRLSAQLSRKANQPHQICPVCKCPKDKQPND